MAREGTLSGVLERHVAEDGQYAEYGAWYEPLRAAGWRRFFRRALPRSRTRRSFRSCFPCGTCPSRFWPKRSRRVRGQCYGQWELCAVDDASTDAAVRECLAAAAAADLRIRVKTRGENGGIAHATNDALAMARGAYCAFLDHDDCIAPDALLCMAEAIAAHPEATLFFSDEDKLDAAGIRARPFFKPAWDGEWIRTTNCVLHFMAVRTQALRDLGGLTPGIRRRTGLGPGASRVRVRRARWRAPHPARPVPLARIARLDGRSRFREAGARRRAAPCDRNCTRTPARNGHRGTHDRRLAHCLRGAATPRRSFPSSFPRVIASICCAPASNRSRRTRRMRPSSSCWWTTARATPPPLLILQHLPTTGRRGWCGTTRRSTTLRCATWACARRAAPSSLW